MVCTGETRPICGAGSLDSLTRAALLARSELLKGILPGNAISKACASRTFYWDITFVDFRYSLPVWVVFIIHRVGLQESHGPSRTPPPLRILGKFSYRSGVVLFTHTEKMWFW